MFENLRRSLVLCASTIAVTALAAGCSGGANPPAAAPTTPPTNGAPAPAVTAASAASAIPVASPAGSPAPVVSPSAAGSPAPNAAPGAFTPPEQTHVSIVYATQSGGNEVLHIADQAGYYQKYGLSAQIQFAESTNSIAALVSGEAQFALSDGVSAAQAIANGANLSIIAYFDRTNPYAILVAPNINQPSDLKGKTFAIAKVGDTSDVSARIGFSTIGLQMGTDVTPLQVGTSPDRFAALLTGQVSGAIDDAVAYVDRAQGQGMHVLVNLQTQHIPYAASALVIRRDYGATNPHTVANTLKALIDAAVYYRDDANQQAVLQTIGGDLQLPPDAPQVLQDYQAYHARIATDPSPTPDGIDTILTTLKAIDPDRFQAVTTDQLIDPSFMDALRQQGFLQTGG